MTSLVLSIVALCIGAANLTWQLALFLLNGPRVRVDMRLGAFGAGGLVTVPVAGNPVQAIQPLRAQGYDNPVVAISVVNRGRQAVELLSFGIEVPKGVAFKPIGEAITTTPMPYLLEPHREATWAMPLELAFNLVKTTKATWPKENPNPLRMFVIQAGGKKIYSKESWSCPLE